MKHPRRSIAILSIALIFTGAILRDLIPLSPDWQSDIGLILMMVGIIALIRLIPKPLRVKSEQ